METASAREQTRQSSFSSLKRGFFFTVLALVLLSFIFISLQLWAQAEAQAEARAAERFRVEALQTALGMVSSDTLSRYANASAMYALQKLATSIENHSDCAVSGMEYYTGPGNLYPDGTYYLNASVYELMEHGNTSGYLAGYQDSSGRFFYTSPNANLTYSSDERKYSLSTFFARTRAAVRMLGYDVQWGEPEGFTLNQTDAWTVSLIMTVPMNFTDSRGHVNVTKRVFVNISLPIDGFTDPSILRADERHRPDGRCNPACPGTSDLDLTNMANRPHHNIYHSPAYDNATQAQAKLKAKGKAGLGWFFGPIADTAHPHTAFQADLVSYNLSRINTYIYVTPSPADALAEAPFFGGLIVTTPPGPPDVVRYTQGGCNYTNFTETNCLFCRFHQETDDPANCPTAPDGVTDASIPFNPTIPWVQTDGDPTIGIPSNYHLSIPEALISNDVNATQMCGPSFNATNRRCDETTSSMGLDIKYADIANTKVWDLTGPRDIALCGFYVRSDFGPSYSQRFTDFWSRQLPNGSYSRMGMGLESFAVGRWAAGEYDLCAQAQPQMERYSRLDYQFYSNNLRGYACFGPFVKGLPGCRNAADCSGLSPLYNATGRFALSNPAYNDQERDLYATFRYNVNNTTFIPLNAIALNSVCK
ncbi:MAG: hypothetical protein M1530_04010 [Candidatus Marsarchaeota archaeon]|nr:hypothetical protein [Candidatus Marsarchaeota archaeon]